MKTSLKEFTEQDFINVNFFIKNEITGIPFPKKITSALDLFTKVPCFSTAKYLTSIWPDALGLFAIGSEERFVNQEFNSWKKSIMRNLELSKNIQLFLNNKALEGNVMVGFHSLRNQEILTERLKMISKKKGLFENKRQYLRNILTKELDCYNLILDLVCIHGIYDGEELFFNGLGANVDAAIYLNSEIMFNISKVTNEFISMTKKYHNV